MTGPLNHSRHDSETAWQYIVDLYAQPGLSETCLDWQDRLGVDVILVLWLLWLGASEGINVDIIRLRQIDEDMKDWRTSVVLPIRAARRSVGAVAKAGDGDAKPLYTRLKMLELEAERTAFTRLLCLESVGSSCAPGRLTAAGNLGRYLDLVTDGSAVGEQTRVTEMALAADGKPTAD